MITFRQITDMLTEQYNNAVDFYYKADFRNFFSNIRNAVDKVCKAIIFDALQDEDIANKILEGKKGLYFARTGKYEIIDFSNGCIPQNRKLLNTAEYALYYKHKDVCFDCSKKEDKKKNINQNINNAFNKLLNLFSDASALGSHSNRPGFDETCQAANAAAGIKAFFDFIKQGKYVTSELQDIFDNLKPISLDAPTQRREEIENGLKEILAKTFSFGENEGGYKFIIILPRKNPGLKSEELEALFKLPCAIVIDFGINDSDDIIASIAADSSSSIRIIKTKDECTSGKYMLNWFFASGDKDGGEGITYTYKEWRIKRYNLLLNVLNGIVEKKSTDKYFIMDFNDEAKYSKYIFDNLKDVFGDEETAISRVKQIFSLSQNSEVQRELNEWKVDCGYTINIARYITLADFLRFVNEKTSSKETSLSCCQSTLKTIAFSEEDLGIYNEAGINIFMPRSLSSKNEVGDFYAGSEISWKELELDYDIKRDKYSAFKNRIIELIRKAPNNTLEYKLKHNPGAGATTMVRRLAYDLYNQCNAEGNDFVCIPVFLDEYNSNTRQYLNKLSEEMDNRFIVAIIDSGNISEESFGLLYRSMSKHNRKVLFLRLFRTGQKNINGGDNTTTLPSNLSEEEIELFFTKYKERATAIGQNKFPSSKTDLRSELEVVDFPLLLNNNTTKGELLFNYAEEYINKSHFSDELKRFCGFVAFANYYGEKPLNQNLVENLYNPSDIAKSSNVKEIKNALEKMLLCTEDRSGRPDGYWRPRFSAFCEPILQAVWGKEWKSKLPNISKEFIEECSNMGPMIGKKDAEMLHAMYILRRGSNFKNVSDDDKTKFSKLIEDVLNEGFLPDSIYKRLIEAYPNDTAYMGHFGRYLFEKTYSEKDTKSDDGKYDEAEKYIRRAIETSPGVDDNYHILGMLYLRKIQALGKELAALKNEEGFDYDDIELRMLGWADKARYGFETSQGLNPASPYGYTAICMLYKVCLEFAQKLKGSEDFSFCDEEEKYMEISELLNNSLSQLGNICQAYEDSVDYMKQSRFIYEKIKSFQYKMLGKASEAVDRYRNLYRQTEDKQKKTFFGKQQIEAMLYNRTKGLEQERRRYYTAFAMGKLKGKDRNEIGEVLKYLRRQGDVSCYENLFWFKMSSSDEFNFDDAIELLQEWLSLCENNDRPQSGKLKAIFYLAVCYSAMAINSEKLCNEYVEQAKKYFEEATKLADRFEINSINSLAFLGEEDDVRCILLPSQQDARKMVKARIEKIDGKKGYAIIPNCGPKLEAFFSNKDNKYDSLRDERKTFITGSIGFRYDGLRIYDTYTETDLTIEELAETVKEEEVETAPINDDKEQETPVSQTETTKSVGESVKDTSVSLGVKVVGKIDPEKLQANRPREVKHNVNTGIDKNGTFVGKIDAKRIYVWAGGEPYYIDKKGEGFKFGWSPNECDYDENEEVYFEKKEGPNYKTGGIFNYAINVRPKAGEDDE